MCNQKYIIFILSIILNITIYAGELPIDWRSGRASGMGDTFVSVSNDENAPFYNPAGIARSRNPRAKRKVHDVNIPGILIGGNVLGLQAFNNALTHENYLPENTAQVISAPSDWFKKDRFGKILDKAINNPGFPLYIEAQMQPSTLLGKKSAATYLISMPLRSEVTVGVLNSNDLSSVYIRSRTTASLALAVADASRANTIAWGFSLRPNYRYSYTNEAYPITESAFSSFRETISTNAIKTFGSPLDVGLLLTAADFWLPTLGVVIKNIPLACQKNYKNPLTDKIYEVCGSPRFGNSNTTISEILDPTEFKIGFSLTPRFRSFGTQTNLRLMVDVFPLPISINEKNYGLSDLNINEIIHAGTELFFGNALKDQSFAIRGGVHGTNFSWGCTFVFLGIEFEYATYPGYTLLANETSREDRRHIIGFTWHL